MMPRSLVVAAALLAACHTSPPAPQNLGLPHATPASLGFDSAALARVAAYVTGQVDSAYPGAVVAVGRHGRLALLAAAGHYGVDDPRPVDPATIYDLASLTKVVGLTTACLLLVDEGKLDLDAPVRTYLPEFQGTDKDRVTIRHLLTHSSGLPAWRPLFQEAATRAAALVLVDTTPLSVAPGDSFIYSDLGAITLAQVVERIAGERLDRYLARRVFEPLGMTATRYLPPRRWRARIAPTENDSVFRHRMIHGEVHDENAGRLGGVSGHAGLFGNAPDLARFAAWLLELRSGGLTPGPTTEGSPLGCPGVAANSATQRSQGTGANMRLGCGTPVHGRGDSLPVVSPATVALFTTRQNLPPGSSRALGWDTPSPPSSAGTRLSARAFGHTGFTGTSIWIDPERDLFIILLTNRVHPTRENTRILRVRPKVADLVVEALADSAAR
jgi:CubicO group peptidase (beta-lactamase class C family)